METLVTTLHVIVTLFLILVVLVQGGNQGGVGAAFGGGNSQGVFGATGATSLLGKLTYVAAIVFMMTSILLAVLQGGGLGGGLSDKLKEKSQSAASPESTLPSQTTESSAPEESGSAVPADSVPQNQDVSGPSVSPSTQQDGALNTPATPSEPTQETNPE